MLTLNLFMICLSNKNVLHYFVVNIKQLVQNLYYQAITARKRGTRESLLGNSA